MRDHVYAGVETGQWLNCCTGEKDSKDMQQLWLRQRPPPTGRGPRAGWAGGEEQRQAKHKGTASAGGGESESEVELNKGVFQTCASIWIWRSKLTKRQGKGNIQFLFSKQNKFSIASN